MFDHLKSLTCRDALADPWPFTAAWILASLLSILIPVIKWSKAKSDYYSSYGYAIDYENQQEEQEGNNNDGNQGYYYRDCWWFDWGCRKKQYQYATNNDGNDNDNGVEIPGWYIFLGGQTEEMRRWKEENGGRGGDSSPTGGEKFVYVWTLIMFLGIVAYGVYVLYKRQRTTGLAVILLFFAQFCLLNLVLVGQGVISADNRDLEDSVYGWYGQWGVLIAYTDFSFMLFSIIFSFAFAARILFFATRILSEQRRTQDEAGKYQRYDAPRVEVTSA